MDKCTHEFRKQYFTADDTIPDSVPFNDEKILLNSPYNIIHKNKKVINKPPKITFILKG